MFPDVCRFSPGGVTLVCAATCDDCQMQHGRLIFDTSGLLPAVGSMLAQEGLVPRSGKEVAVLFTVAAVRRSHGCRQRIVLIL